MYGNKTAPFTALTRIFHNIGLVAEVPLTPEWFTTKESKLRLWKKYNGTWQKYGTIGDVKMEPIENKVSL